jgi:hypothetical protein
MGIKLIAHRGLVNGPNSKLENHPNTITQAWDMGFDCEIDLRVSDSGLWLGHDGAQYNIEEDFLKKGPLWIHAKNLQALEYLQQDYTLNYFWHQDDDYTLTSKGYVWAYPGQQLSKFAVNVMPEWNNTKLEDINLNCYAICSDWVVKIKEKYTSELLRR